MVDVLISIAEHSMTIITAITVLLSVVSFAMVNTTRYNQSEKFGVPYRITQTSVNEVIGVWFEVLILLVFGTVLPIVFFFVHIASIGAFFMFILIIFLAFTGRNNILVLCIRKHWKKNKKYGVLIFVVLMMLLIIFSIAFTIFHYYVQSENLNNVDNALKYIFALRSIVIYISTMIILTIFTIINGFMKSIVVEQPITTCIDGKQYLITFCFNSDKYILLSCDIYESENKILFEKGSFLIKSLEGLKINYRADFEIDLKNNNKNYKEHISYNKKTSKNRKVKKKIE